MKNYINFKNIFLILLLCIVAFLSYSIYVSNTDPKLTTIKTPEIPKALTALQVQDEKVGDGAELKSGMTAKMHYTGKLANGTEFDSSYKTNQPFETPIGQGKVIPGWDQGLVGMKVGGKRKLSIPASLAYGAQGQGGIPANSDLYFDVELLEVK
jgi:FKBP-type peptidyl-prolyl cis-trans isomerase